MKPMRSQDKKIYVLDTNIILDGANNIFNYGLDNTIVITDTTLDEIDSKKSGTSEIAFQAREFGRLLQDSKLIETKQTSDYCETILSLNGMELVIISLKNPEKTRADDKILEVFKYLPKHAKFISNDVLCRYKGISLGVTCEMGGQIIKNDLPIIQKTLELDYKTFENLPIDILEVDKDYTKDIFCYILKCGNSSKLGYVVNGELRIITDETFEYMVVRPQNVGQRFSLAAMLDLDIDISVVEALAGSGKTLLAVAAGIKHMRAGNFNKIVYIRNSIESTEKVEEVGFLPGLSEKFKIYNYPLYDTLEFIADKSKMKGTATSENDDIDPRVYKLMDKYKIETMWNGSIRGRTISRSFVIIDEVQNFSKSSLQTVLSRVDKDCKVVLIGSNRQIDHPYITKNTNGLSIIQRALKNDNPEVVLHGSKMEKVLRGRITEFAERIFES